MSKAKENKLMKPLKICKVTFLNCYVSHQRESVHTESVHTESVHTESVHVLHGLQFVPDNLHT